MKRIRELVEDAVLCAGCFLFVLYACAFFWICRLFGVDLGDDF